MSRALNLKRLAGLAALALVLVVVPACNEHDDPGQAEAVVLVKTVTTAGLSVAAPEPTSATVSFVVNVRGAAEGVTFWNDVTLTSYTVSFSPAVIAAMSGAVSTGFCPAGGECSVIFDLVPNGSKPAAGTVVIASVDVEGRDANQNPVNFSFTVPLAFVP
jgi:hypothetical protein